MAFDLSTAKPVSGGFDIASAQPEPQQLAAAQPEIGALLSQFEAAKSQGDFQAADAIQQQINAMQHEGIKGSLNILGAGAVGTAKEVTKGLSALGGLAMGRGVGESLAGAEALASSIPDVEIGEEGLAVLKSISDKFETSPEIIKDIVRSSATLGESLGDTAFKATGNPAFSAAVATLPTALVEAIGFGAPGAAARIPKAAAKQLEATASKGVDIPEGGFPLDSEEGLKQVSDVIKTGTPEEVASVVNPDPAFFRAADELNINTEPLASFASQNPQFRAVEQGLASIPASQLDVQGKAFISELSQKADDLIVQYGGTLDKGSLSDQFRLSSISAIDDLGEQADKLYDSLATKIPPSSRVEAPSTVSFIRQKAQELGGVGELPPVLNRVLRQLEVKDKTGAPTKRIDVITGQPIPSKVTRTLPTHERLNQTRREIGQALNRGTGPFKDQETGLLKGLYARLRGDQDAAAGQFGASDVSDSANAIVRQRKQLEDNLGKLLGKDLEGSILPVVGQSLKRLSKGEVQKWDSVMSRIPKSMRQDIVVSSLNDIFKGNNVQGQALNPTQFTKFMDDLNRSPATKNRLYKELPKESIAALENLRALSKGVSVALQDKIPTGRVAAFFEDKDGFLRRLMGKAIVLGVTAKAGPLAASAAGEFINQTTNGAKTASAVLASGQFQNIMRTAISEGVQEGGTVSARLKKAEKAFEKSKTFEQWSKALSDDDRAKLGSFGTINYLLQDTEEE